MKNLVYQRWSKLEEEALDYDREPYENYPLQIGEYETMEEATKIAKIHSKAIESEYRGLGYRIEFVEKGGDIKHGWSCPKEDELLFSIHAVKYSNTNDELYFNYSFQIEEGERCTWL